MTKAPKNKKKTARKPKSKVKLTPRKADASTEPTTSVFLGDPSTPSMAYTASIADWVLVRTLLNGTRAVRGAREAYLPKFPDETDTDYDLRVLHAPFVNHFRDNLETIVSKPFSKEVSLQGDVTPTIREFCENVDGQGTSIHKFARDMFKEAIAQGVVGVLVDFPKVPAGATLAEERSLNACPNWISYQAEDILAMYSEFRKGRRVVTHLRLREDAVEPTGYSEKRIHRVRILEDDGTTRSWALWEQSGRGWAKIDEGDITLDEIPFRLYKPGEREWWSNATISPLIDLAYLQIEHYQQSSNLKHILNAAGFPMLAGNGIAPPINPMTGQPATIKVGPAVVCFAPPIPGTTTVPEWKFIEPSGTSIDKLQSQIDRIEEQMAKIGKAPLVRNSGGITATAQAVNAAKGHATAEAWAIDLKDTLEELLEFTAAWMNEQPKAEVFIHTDFGVELRESSENTELMDAHSEGVISRETLYDEWKRRAFLGPQFDPQVEMVRVAEDQKRKIEEQKALIAAGVVPVANNDNQPGAVGNGRKNRKKAKKGKVYDQDESQTAKGVTTGRQVA